MEPAPQRILVADDEEDLVWALRQSLRDEGYEVLTAHDGAGALSLARRYRPHLVILDINMPGMSGLEVCHTLRRDPALAAVPIMFLTVRSRIEDKLEGLNEGSDDYVVKPFDMRELKARVRALLRRSQSDARQRLLPEGQEHVLTLGPLALDLGSRQVWVKNKLVQLTPAQFDLLHYLMMHPGEAFSSETLLRVVWGCPPEAASPALVRWHIRNLRLRIERDPAHPVYVCCLPHHGYILRCPE